jgi:FixJ family two-component response regulator
MSPTPTPTPRQHQLIALIRRGLQNKEIAHELNISDSTVHAHVTAPIGKKAKPLAVLLHFRAGGLGRQLRR